MLLGREKVDFLYLPTPLEYLPNISEDLGINLYIKRDDLTPLGMGGNKLRKLEYLVKDAKDQGCTFLLTVGGAQTNHGRLTMAVARKYGMRGAIVCVDEYPKKPKAKRFTTFRWVAPMSWESWVTMNVHWNWHSR